jgi:hypothetical protein
LPDSRLFTFDSGSLAVLEIFRKPWKCLVMDKTWGGGRWSLVGQRGGWGACLGGYVTCLPQGREGRVRCTHAISANNLGPGTPNLVPLWSLFFIRSPSSLSLHLARIDKNPPSESSTEVKKFDRKNLFQSKANMLMLRNWNIEAKWSKLIKLWI